MMDLKIEKTPFDDHSDAISERYKGVNLSFSWDKYVCDARIYDDEKDTATILAFYDQKRKRSYDEFESKRSRDPGMGVLGKLAGYQNPYSLAPEKIPYSNPFFKEVAKWLYEKMGVSKLTYPIPATSQSIVSRERVYQKPFFEFFKKG
jgi:hypothetical protein